MKQLFTCTLVGLLAVAQAPTQAQTPSATPHPTVTGAVTYQFDWSVVELARQPHVTVTAKDKQGQEHRYRSVALSTIVQAAGAEGKPHGQEFMKALKVTAADSNQAFFALTVVEPAFASQTIILADQCDEKPLAAGAGPWQIIVPAEKKPGRWVRQVTSRQVGTLP